MKYLLTSLFFITTSISADSLLSSPKISLNDAGLRVIELKEFEIFIFLLS